MYIAIGYIFHPQWESLQPIKRELKFNDMEHFQNVMEAYGVKNYIAMLEECDEDE